MPDTWSLDLAAKRCSVKYGGIAKIGVGNSDLWNVKHEKLSSCYGQVKMRKLDVLWTRRGLLSPFAAGRHGDGVWGIQGKHPRAEGSMRSMTSIFLSLPPKNVHALAKGVKAVQTL